MLAGKLAWRRREVLCAICQTVKADGRGCRPFSLAEAVTGGLLCRSLGYFVKSIPWILRCMGWIWRSVGYFGWKECSESCHMVAKIAFSASFSANGCTYVLYYQCFPIFAYLRVTEHARKYISFSVLKMVRRDSVGQASVNV